MEANVDLTISLPHVSSTLLSAAGKTRYRKGIGLVMYTLMTCPDIVFAIGTLSQHLKRPMTTHMEALKHVVHCLKGTKEFKLTLGSTSSEFITFTNSDFASHLHHHSISGFACY